MANATDFYFCRPDEMTIGWTGSGGADTGYDEDWLTDGRPGRPVRAATGTETWTSTGASTTVSIVAVCNHNIDAARTITMGGDISLSLAGPTLPPSGIPLNPWGSVSETACTSITLAVSSNTVPIIVGEAIYGKRRTLERSLLVRPKITPTYQTVALEAEFDSLMPYDKGIVSRQLTGQLVLTDSGLSAVQDWWDATRGNSKPSLIVPYTDVQDAWLVKFSAFSYEHGSKNRNFVSVTFDEFPRSRW